MHIHMCIYSYIFIYIRVYVYIYSHIRQVVLQNVDLFVPATAQMQNKPHAEPAAAADSTRYVQAREREDAE